MNKKSFNDSISDEVLAKLIDDTLNFKKTTKNKNIKTHLLRIIPAAAAIILVLGLINLLPLLTNVNVDVEPDDTGMENYNYFVKQEINVDDYTISFELPWDMSVKNFDDNDLFAMSLSYISESKIGAKIIKDGVTVGSVALASVNVTQEMFETYTENPEQNYRAIYYPLPMGSMTFAGVDYKIIYESEDKREGTATDMICFRSDFFPENYLGFDMSRLREEIIEGDPRSNYYLKSILGYNLDLGRIAVIELYYDAVTNEELTRMAESLRISLPQNNNTKNNNTKHDIIFYPESPVYKLSFELPKDMSLELTYGPGPDPGKLYDKCHDSSGQWKIIKDSEIIGIITISEPFDSSYNRSERIGIYKENPEHNFRAIYDQLPMGSMLIWGPDYKIAYEGDDYWEGAVTSLIYYRSDFMENNGITDVSRFRGEVIDGDPRIGYSNKSIVGYNLNLKDPVAVSIEIYYDAVTDEELTHIAETLRIGGEEYGLKGYDFNIVTNYPDIAGGEGVSQPRFGRDTNLNMSYDEMVDYLNRVAYDFFIDINDTRDLYFIFDFTDGIVPEEIKDIYYINKYDINESGEAERHYVTDNPIKVPEELGRYIFSAHFKWNNELEEIVFFRVHIRDYANDPEPAPAVEVPAPTAYIDFNISIRPEQYNENPFYENGIKKIIKSVEELKSLCKDESYSYTAMTGTGTEGMYLRDLSQDYNDEYFRENALIAVTFEYSSSSIPRNIYKVEVRDNILIAWAYQFEDMTLPENEKFTSGLCAERVFLIEVKKSDVEEVTEVFPGIDGAPVIILPEVPPPADTPAVADEVSPMPVGDNPIYIESDIGFPVAIPASWEDKYVVLEWGNAINGFSVYHKATYDMNPDIYSDMGELFNISRHEGVLSDEYIGEYSDSTTYFSGKDYYIAFIVRTNGKYFDSTKDEYLELAEQVDEIKRGIPVSMKEAAVAEKTPAAPAVAD